jgi:hypothetical protein
MAANHFCFFDFAATISVENALPIWKLEAQMLHFL